MTTEPAAESDGEASKDERAPMGARRGRRPSGLSEEGCTLRLLEQRPLAFLRECAPDFGVDHDHGRSLSGRSDTSEPGLRVVDFAAMPIVTQYTDRYVYYRL
jgi:hypothetical protein